VVSSRVTGHGSRLFIASLLLCLFASPLLAQNVTAVSGTVRDLNGIPYANATVQAQLVPSGITPTIPPPCNGQSSTPCAVSAFSRASTDSGGNFSMALASNAVLSPGGTQWQFTVNETGVAPPLGTGSQTCSATFSISGASQSVSSSLSTCPALGSSPSVVTTFDAAAQNASIGSTALFTSISAKALYRISLHARVTTAAGVSSTLGPVTVSWTDAQLGAQSSIIGTFNSADGSTIAGGAASGNLTTSKLSGVLNVDPAPSTPVTFTVGYASNPANAMQYAVHLRVELLGTIP